MKKLIALLLCLLLPLAAAMAETAAEAPLLEVHQLMLGYADGYYIRCGDVEMLIDGGKENTYAKDHVVLDQLRDLGADKLDVYIVTHWHLDHCGNVNPILAAYGTQETVVYSPAPELPNVILLEKGQWPIAPLSNGVHRQMITGDVVTLGDLTLTCIGPKNGGRNGRHNPDSLNIVLQYGTRRMLFTGDYASSNLINTTYAELCSQVDVLKFPHHGSEPYCIGDKALRRTAPTYVLVPSQMNNYSLYMHLNNLGVKIPRENVLTQRGGHTVILTDGGDYLEAKTQQNPADYAPKTN